uniref:Cytoskeleton-associated protein 2 C-terminal domain-containing protein n=1 Tax=Aotus nancymaae TaxID=37293 RepID=A0A2K5EUU0_AOTNA
MVGSGPAAAAAVEERQRKLQEYLAAKGKLKSQNAKPYLKSKNNCPNPLPSKSTIRPKNDVTDHAVLPVKPKMSISVKLQPRPLNITGSQKPKLEPPKLLGKRLTSECVSSNHNSKLRKLVGSLNIEQLKTTKQQVTDQGNAKCTDSMNNTHVENESLDNFLKETNKGNLPQTLSEPERKPDPKLHTTSKPKIDSYNQTKNSLVPKPALGKSSVNSAVLKDRVNKQFVRETQSRTLSRFARPGVKLSRTTLNKVQPSKKPVVKNIKDIKVNRGTNETKLRSYPVTEQRMKHTKPRTYPNLLQGEYNNRHPNIKQDQKSTQPSCITQTSCILQKSKAISQRPKLTVGRFNSAIPSTPSIRANGTSGIKCNNNGFQQTAQTLDSKLKKAVPQNHFLNKTAAKTQAGVTTINGTQTNPNIKKKATAEDRRYFALILSFWKIYKRPPMELKTKRKAIKEMNISFWKSIEKEEEEKKAQFELSSKINNTLTECLNLIEGGVPYNEILNILSSIPEAEKFAKFWICKAKLLASKGTFDAIGLYEEAIKNGATPIQELREVVLNILQDSNRTKEGITSDSLVAETNIASVEELAKEMESVKPCLSPEEREQAIATPQIAKAEQHNYSGIKLQIGPIPRINGMPEVQDMKLITPVRRSSRIERAVSQVGETTCFIFRRNEALPVTLGFQIPD